MEMQRGKSPKTVSDIRSFSPVCVNFLLLFIVCDPCLQQMLPVVEAAASACFHQPSKLLQFKAAALLTSPLLLSNRTVATCVHAVRSKMAVPSSVWFSPQLDHSG